MTDAATVPPDPMVPRPFRVARRRRELADTFTLELEAEDGDPFAFLPGQFNMLYAFGTGESAISISGDPAAGGTAGVRGPFGSAWPVDAARGRDVVIVAGGIGLAPLRPAILHVLANRADYGRVVILYGARSPEDILYQKQLEKWRGRFDMFVDVTVDRADARWGGKIGVVPRLVEKATFAPEDTVAMVCGPEIMMRSTVHALNAAGVSDADIFVSLERNMKCAVGFCGHCQFGGRFVCRDGPVFAHADVRDHLVIREL